MAEQTPEQVLRQRVMHRTTLVAALRQTTGLSQDAAEKAYDAETSALAADLGVDDPTVPGEDSTDLPTTAQAVEAATAPEVPVAEPDAPPVIEPDPEPEEVTDDE